MLEQEIKALIRDVKDFPKPGIVFKDLTPILKNPELCKRITREFCEKLSPFKPDAIACLDSRGFWFGLMIATEMGIEMLPVRKAGKLPGDKISETYNLEYGTATIEMHSDSIHKGSRVIVHDDLLATGGTAEACAKLIQKQGGIVAGFAFGIELSFIEGTKKLLPYSENIYSMITY